MSAMEEPTLTHVAAFRQKIQEWWNAGQPATQFFVLSDAYDGEIEMVAAQAAVRMEFVALKLGRPLTSDDDSPWIAVYGAPHRGEGGVVLVANTDGTRCLRHIAAPEPGCPVCLDVTRERAAAATK